METQGAVTYIVIKYIVTIYIVTIYTVHIQYWICIDKLSTIAMVFIRSNGNPRCCDLYSTILVLYYIVTIYVTAPWVAIRPDEDHSNG